jgi:Cu(I)/Ag(I) efflux system protein CusF
MRKLAFVPFVIATSVLATSATAQQKTDEMKGMPMNGTEGMKDMNMGKPMAPAAKTHKAAGVVKAVDAKAGMVTVAHGPVPTLNWDAMTMDFKVKDKKLLDKFAQGKKVEFEFVEQGDDYVVTAVK